MPGGGKGCATSRPAAMVRFRVPFVYLVFVRVAEGFGAIYIYIYVHVVCI